MSIEFRELSHAKLNLFLKIISKREDGYHNIRSGITLINLFDEVTVEKNSEFKVKYIGEFAPINNMYSDCIIEKIFSKFNLTKPNFSFTIKKNIPVQSGLGSASSNAATVIRILEKLNYQGLRDLNYSDIGKDIPFFVKNQDALVRGVGNIMIKKLFPKYFFLIVKPKQNCSTLDMYNQINIDNVSFNFSLDTNEISEDDNGNDFETIAESKYDEIYSLLKFTRSLPEVIFTRLTGSGSCIFSAFENKNNAEKGLLKFKDRYPDLWIKVAENNFL